MSTRDFLKSVEGKLLNNKRKAQPDMRMDALLGCTSKRIRREIRCEISRESRAEQVNDNFANSLRTMMEKNIETNSLIESNDGDVERDLVDDPKQVELFLRQVESQTQPQLNNNKEVETGSALPCPYPFLDKPSNLSELSGDNDIDLNLGVLCANFDSLYEDLLESLVSVERWMNMTSGQTSDSGGRDQGILSQDQHETMMDLSKLLGI